MKHLLLDSLALCKDLLLLRADRALYIVLAGGSAAAFIAGIAAGPLL